MRDEHEEDDEHGKTKNDEFESCLEKKVTDDEEDEDADD